MPGLLENTRKMKKVSDEAPVTVDDTAKHELRIGETSSYVAAYGEILELVLRTTLSDCAILTPVSESAKERLLLGVLSAFSNKAKARSAKLSSFAVPKKFDSPVVDPINNLGHYFFETGLPNAKTAFERSVRDKGYFSVLLPDGDAFTTVICCCMFFDGVDCPAEAPGVPDRLVYSRLLTARFFAQLELCKDSMDKAASEFSGAAAQYIEAFKALRNARSSGHTESCLKAFRQGLRSSLSTLRFKQMIVTPAKTSSVLNDSWETNAAEVGQVEFQHVGDDLVAKLPIETINANYEVTFVLARHSKSILHSTLNRRLITTYLQKVVADLSVVALDQNFEKTFCRTTGLANQ